MSMKIDTGNLIYDIAETELDNLFAPFEKVEGIKIITGTYSEKSKGFAFVEMSNPEEEQKASNDLRR